MTNSTLLVGNLTAAPKLFSKKGKTPRAIFTIAINEKFGDGDDDERTHFVQCTAWGTLGENLANSLIKGTRVVAVARINTYSKEVEIDEDEVNLTMTSFTVTAIGPDLRWATAEVEKVKPANSRDDEEEDEDREEAPKAKAKSKVKSKSKQADPADEDNEDDDDEF